MKIIQEIVRKFNGEYKEYDKREIHTPQGKYVTQLQEGTIIIDTIKFSIILNKSIGINFNISGADKIFNEPIRIILHLKSDEESLNIYPKNNFQKLMSLFQTEKTKTEHIIKGKNIRIPLLKKNEELIKRLNNEKLFISINEKYPKKILLISENGIKDTIRFENYAEILKIISQT